MMLGLSGSGVRTQYEGMPKAAYSCRFVWWSRNTLSGETTSTASSGGVVV